MSPHPHRWPRALSRQGAIIFILREQSKWMALSLEMANPLKTGINRFVGLSTLSRRCSRVRLPSPRITDIDFSLSNVGFGIRAFQDAHIERGAFGRRWRIPAS
jgi:hypothetical protein